MLDPRRLLAEVRKYGPGDCVPVYHNYCGKRSTYLPCSCSTCQPKEQDDDE